jgi:hypothetical protein
MVEMTVKIAHCPRVLLFVEWRARTAPLCALSVWLDRH